MVKNFNEHFCRRYKEIYAYLIENFIKSQSLYIIYLESWSYEHFSIMFRCFDWSKLFSGWTMDRVSASRTEWQSLSNTKSTWSEWDEWVTYFSLNENWLELTWFRTILSHFFSARIYSSSFISFEEIRNKIFFTYLNNPWNAIIN